MNSKEKRLFDRHICIALAVLIIILTGCGGKRAENHYLDTARAGEEAGSYAPDDLSRAELDSDTKNADTAGQNQSDGSAGGDAAMGRYVELETDLSDQLQYAMDMQMLDDGTVMIQDADWRQLISRDNGRTWEEAGKQRPDETAAGAARFPEQITLGVLGKDGASALFYTEQTENNNAIYHYTVIEADGREIPFQMEPGLYVQKMRFAENGELFLLASDHYLYRFDKTKYRQADVSENETELPKAERYLEVGKQAGTFAIGNHYIIVPETDRAMFYDMNEKRWFTDELLNDFIAARHIPIYGGYRNSEKLLLVMMPGDILYLVYDGGIFRHALNGSLFEQIIGGSGKLGSAKAEIINMVPLDNNEFLALYTDNKLCRYVFEPDVPTMAAGQITIYSLSDSGLLREAATIFQAQNPDISIHYEVGMDNTDNAVNALKNLEMDLKSGNGPDLMLLDDMPISSFSEQGFLADVSPYLTDGYELLPAVRNSYARDGRLPAVPLAFKVPMIAGEARLVEAGTDLTSLADVLEVMKSEEPETTVLDFRSAEKALAVLSQGVAYTWQKPDGSMDETAIKTFLLQAKRIYELEPSEQIPVPEGPWPDRDYLTSYGFITGRNKAALGYITNVHDIAFLAQAMGKSTAKSEWGGSNKQNGEEMEWGLQKSPGTPKAVFRPAAIIGINAASPNQAAAGELLRIMLGEAELLSNHGFPAEINAYAAHFTYTDYSQVGFSWTEDGLDYRVQLGSPEETWLAGFRRIADSADTPDLTESSLREAVVEEGVPFLEGSAAIEAAISAIRRRAAE